MDLRQVQSSVGVTLVGGGDPSRESLDEALKFAPTLVAADGGADRALAFGHVPQTVIGDLDSVSEAAISRVGAENVVQILDQNRTDFEKSIAVIDAPFVLAVGFANARIDHTLAVMTGLVCHVGAPVIVVGDEDLVFAAPLQLAVDLEVGTRFSVYPMTEVRGRSTGLEWPLDPHVFSPNGRVGTSNRVTGPVRLEFDGPGMLVITPRAALARVVAALIG